jgi:iron complex transport system ATP-binding protein
MVVIEARGIVLRLAGRTLLSRVSLQAHRGELYGLLGPNGAGKSTLLRALSGELEPDAGEVRLAGAPLQRWTPRERARLRALAQENSVCFALTALDMTLLGRFPHHDGFPVARDERIALQALAKLDATHLAHRRYLSLSGGERARVQLARILAQLWEPWRGNPRCILLDEPIATLDLLHQHQTLALIRALAATEGMAVVAVLHDLNLVLQYADRVTLLSRGAVYASGRTREVITPAALRGCFGLAAKLVQPCEAAHPLVLPMVDTAPVYAGTSQGSVRS